MPRGKGISDEAIIAALIETGSATKAAQALGITPRTIYDRQKDDDFLELYQTAKADMIRGAVYSINRQLSDAVDVVAAIMHDESTNPATRLQAAQTIINASAKLAERLAADETPREEDLLGRIYRAK